MAVAGTITGHNSTVLHRHQLDYSGASHEFIYFKSEHENEAKVIIQLNELREHGV